MTHKNTIFGIQVVYNSQKTVLVASVADNSVRSSMLQLLAVAAVTVNVG